MGWPNGCATEGVEKLPRGNVASFQAIELPAKWKNVVHGHVVFFGVEWDARVKVERG